MVHKIENPDRGAETPTGAVTIKSIPLRAPGICWTGDNEAPVRAFLQPCELVDWPSGGNPTVWTGANNLQVGLGSWILRIDGLVLLAPGAFARLHRVVPRGAETPAGPLADLRDRIAASIRHVGAYGLGGVDADQIAESLLQGVEPHIYLSTSCLHGLHGYCHAPDGAFAKKTPAKCKFCPARCICSCHRLTSEETPPHA